jgi:tetrahydromethanopterin S-methyltransferase subunit B
MPKMSTILIVGIGLIVSLKYPYVLGLIVLALVALYLKDKNDNNKTGI